MFVGDTVETDSCCVLNERINEWANERINGTVDPPMNTARINTVNTTSHAPKSLWSQNPLILKCSSFK
jgi:hypothetical protein